MVNATHIITENPPTENLFQLGINSHIRGKYKGKDFAAVNDGFKLHTVTVDDLARHIQQGYAIAPVCNGRRKADNFVSAQHIGLDFDTETDACRLDTLARDLFIAQYAAIAHTTASHTDEKPRARVILILDEPVTDRAEFARYLSALVAKFDIADQAASDPARMFYGAVDCDLRLLNNGENRLPVTLLRELADQHEAELAAARPPMKPYSPPKTDQGSDRARKYGIAALDGIAANIASAPQGDRHNKLYTNARKCGVLVREGLISPDEARAALDNAARAAGLDENDTERTIRDGMKKGAGDSADWLPNFDKPKTNLGKPEPDYEIIEAPRHYENGLPHGIRELLNNWHLNGWVHIEGDDVPRLDGFYTYLEIRHDLILRGVVEPDAALSAHELANLNRFGYAYKTIRNIEETAELLQFLFPYIEPLNTGKESATITQGRPTNRYQLPFIDEMWDRFFDYFRPQMWRALLVTKYHDLPVDVLEYARDLFAMDELQAIDFSYDDIGLMNDTIHPLLVEHDDRLREAMAELDWRIDHLRRRYIEADDCPPYMLAPGVTFTKTSQHKDLHLAITMQRDGGEIEDRYATARAGGWTLPAYRSALKRAEKLLNEAIVTVPNFTERGTITSEVESVVLACEAVSQNAFMRGRIELHAQTTGNVVTVSPGYARNFDYDEWLADNGGKADVYVWDRSIDKLDSRTTAEERANQEKVSNRQKAINSRRDYEAEKEARAERASEPGINDRWVHNQGVMIASLFDVSPDEPHIFRAIVESARLADEQKAPSTNAETRPAADSTRLDHSARMVEAVNVGVFHDRNRQLSAPAQSEPGNGQRISKNGGGVENSRHAQYASADQTGDISRNQRGLLQANQQGQVINSPDVRNGTRPDTQTQGDLDHKGANMPAVHYNEPAEPGPGLPATTHTGDPAPDVMPMLQRAKSAAGPVGSNQHTAAPGNTRGYGTADDKLARLKRDHPEPIAAGLPATTGKYCSCCGQVATVSKLGGDFCAEHADLSLDERFALADEFQAGQKIARVTSGHGGMFAADAAR
jgi:hypothetical protein